jgi:hypothetical protein
VIYILFELELERNFAILNDQRSWRELQNENVGLSNELNIDNQYLFWLEELCKYINHSVFKKLLWFHMQKSTYLFHKFQYISTQTCPNWNSKIVYKKNCDTICKKHDSVSQFLVNIHSNLSHLEFKNCL